MAQVLLDTHVLVWSLFDRRLSAKAHRAVQEADARLVSAVTLYEIDSKRRHSDSVRAGELQLLPADLLTFLPAAGYRLTPVTPEQAFQAANLPIAHGDPWDRILIAQARDLGVPLISQDRALHDQAGDTPVIW